MRIMQAIKEAVANISRSRLRTCLTMLGLIVGISSVISLVGLGEGSNREVEDRMKALGGDILTGYLFGASLEYHDIEQLRANPIFSKISPSKNLDAKVSAGRTVSNRGYIEAADEQYLEARNLSLSKGRNLSSVDRDNKSKVCILGPSIAKVLFGTADALGKTVRIGGHAFTVVGILHPQGDSLGGYTDDLVIVPFTLFSEFNADGGITGLYARAFDKKDASAAKSVIEQYLASEKNLPANKYAVYAQEEMIDAQDSISETMTMMMAGIAGISLIVAGIGVMNVMLVSVAERVREIGIKKALGARRLDILLQFLIEAMLVSLVGGVCGIAVGLLFGVFASNAGIRFEPSLSMVFIAVAASVTVGLAFGIFPAYKASRMNPIDALRQE